MAASLAFAMLQIILKRFAVRDFSGQFYWSPSAYPQLLRGGSQFKTFFSMRFAREGARVELAVSLCPAAIAADVVAQGTG